LTDAGEARSTAKFVTIGYGDRAGYDRTDAAVRNAAHEQDALLEANGALVGVAGKPAQVRNPDATGVRIYPGAFMKSDLPIAGFAVIEAADIDEAVALCRSPPARWRTGW
jgi:hypothetical protein